MSVLRRCLLLQQRTTIFHRFAVYNCAIYHQKPNQHNFHTSIEGTRLNIPEQFKSVEFKTVYSFPYIRFGRFIARLKLYQTALTALAVPTVCIGYYMDHVDLDMLQSVIGVTTFAGIMLYVMGNFIRRLVGTVAINEKLDYVRLSRLTFWGNRRDLYVPLKNIIPLSDYCLKPMDTYVTLKTFDSDDVLFMSIRYGGIKDIDAFQKIFGNVMK